AVAVVHLLGPRRAEQPLGDAHARYAQRARSGGSIARHTVRAAGDYALRFLEERLRGRRVRHLVAGATRAVRAHSTHLHGVSRWRDRLLPHRSARTVPALGLPDTLHPLSSPPHRGLYLRT